VEHSNSTPPSDRSQTKPSHELPSVGTFSVSYLARLVELPRSAIQLGMLELAPALPAWRVA